MDIFHINETQTLKNPEDYAQLLKAGGFLWLDATHEEVAANPEEWRNLVEQISGTQIYDLHLKDVSNLSHPSYFDATQDYEMVVFRKLTLTEETVDVKSGNKRKIPAALNKLATTPVSFLLMENVLVTVRPTQSRTVELARQRLLDYKYKAESTTHGGRLPASPEELMLRLLNAMVDQYLELRQPLTQQLDRWQHALLDPRRPFNNWMALLDSRVELRKLDNLCEEQRDAMQELRDHIVDNHDGNSRAKDLLLVRINDVMEHISRVLNHARRLEASLESAVQIHFAAMAHRTSEIMRTLTVITALFMPLTLITGIFGMNFEVMPLLKHASGFWITMGAMGVIVVLLLIYFRSQRYLEDQASRRRE
ncbi:magnesium transporter CorA family protein [Undibacterium sp. CY18W]|uniref:Magnesium transporter CorA family protein n=1 Tax=Undibacterium hunanense TaxID=2762292 RepID=A0ABR6ZY76_9BURK|nr:magnesium transporter CorA family protein [Undibacterium hunanense]MBC3920709.1 magnesium transporter CorA family protein [Undibacterium hunanense]